MDSVVVLGGGGHGKVVVSTLQEAGYRVVAVYDDNPVRWKTSILGVPIVGPCHEAASQSACLAVIAIGANAVRECLAARFSLRWTTVIHPRAYVHRSVRLGVGTVVFAGAVIQPDATLGDHVIVNTGATVDHDCRIGDFVHLAPGVHVAGDVQVGNGAFLGTGSVIIPGRKVGLGAVVGAGAVVIRDVPNGARAVGVPARSSPPKSET